MNKLVEKVISHCIKMYYPTAFCAQGIIGRNVSQDFSGVPRTNKERVLIVKQLKIGDSSEAVRPLRAEQLAIRKSYCRHDSEPRLTYAVLGYIDVMRNIMIQGSYMIFKEASGFLSANKFFRSLIGDFKDLLFSLKEINSSQLRNEASSFLEAHDQKVKVEITTNEELANFVKQLKEPAAKNYLNQIITLSLSLDIKDDNIAHVNEVLKVLGSKLESFSCGDIWSGLTLEGLPKLHTFACEEISIQLTLKDFPELHTFACGGIWKKLTLEGLPKLYSFACRGIWNKLTLERLPKLYTFSCKQISDELTLKSLPELYSFACEDIRAELTLERLLKLYTFSCGGIFKLIMLQEVPHLRSLSYEYISTDLKLPQGVKLVKRG